MKLIDGLYLCTDKKYGLKTVMVSRGNSLVGGRYYPKEIGPIFKPSTIRAWKGNHASKYPPKYLLLPKEFLE